MFIILIFLVPFIFLDSKPLVIKSSQLNSESLHLATNLIKTIHKQLLSQSNQHSFSIDIQQLEALLSLASQTLKPISARVNYLDDILIISTSIKLPIPIPLRYLNIQIRTSGDLLNSPDSYSQIGPLELSNNTLLTLVKAPLFVMFSNIQRDAINNSIHSVKFKNNLIVVQADPFIDVKYLSSIFKFKAKQALALASLNKSNTLNPKIVSYYQFLNKISTYISSISNPKLSLQSISAPLFKEANNRSLTSNNTIEENKAALIALALFVGDYNLQRAIKNTFGITSLKTGHNINFILNERQDLVLHFIYSAMIKILANSNISTSIGEIKEISDSAKGGSGFSFPDLLADRAGIHFANRALDSSFSAEKLQKNISVSTSELDFFPSIAGLPEGLSAQQFKTTYGNKDTVAFKAMIKKIDRRINGLKIYN